MSIKHNYPSGTGCYSFCQKKKKWVQYTSGFWFILTKILQGLFKNMGILLCNIFLSFSFESFKLWTELSPMKYCKSLLLEWNHPFCHAITWVSVLLFYLMWKHIWCRKGLNFIIQMLALHNKRLWLHSYFVEVLLFIPHKLLQSNFLWCSRGSMLSNIHYTYA